MLSSTFICKTDRIGLTPLTIGGGPAFQRSEVLHAGLTRRCGRDVSNLFADPLASDDGRTISWYSEGAGEPRPLASLDREMRKAPEALLRAQLATLAPILSDANLGPLLSAALYIGTANDIWVIDDRPLLCNWGFVPASADKRQPTSLAGHFISTLGAYAAFAPPRLDGDSFTTTPLRMATTPSQGESVSTRLNTPAYQPAPRSPEKSAPPWRAPLIAVAIAASVLLFLTLPHVLRSWFGADYSSALTRARALNELLATKIASIEKSLEEAVCLNGGFSGGADLPPGDPSQIPVPPTGGSAGATGAMKLDERLNDAVVMVLVVKKKGGGHGSGFFIGPRSIVTNNHVVRGATEIYVINKKLAKLTPATVVAHTPGTIDDGPDFAVLKIAEDGPSGPDPLPLSAESKLQQWVVVAGYPGVTTMVDAAVRRLKDGAIPAQSQSIGNIMQVLPLPDQDPPLIAINTAISHGNSGGPVVDQCARVLGVATFETGGRKEEDFDKGYFAIAASGLTAFLDSVHVDYVKASGSCAGEAPLAGATR